MTLELSQKSQDVQAMFDRIAPRYDLLNRLLSARQDVRWRKSLIAAMPQMTGNRGGVLYDVACGTGDVLIAALGRRADYTKAQGFDISQGMMDAGMRRRELVDVVSRRGSQGRPVEVGFTLASAENLPVPEASGDAVSIAFGLRNVDDRPRALREFSRVLRPGGRLLVLEFFPARSTFFARVFDIYFKRILPLVGGLLSDRASYEYLPKSVASMPSGVEFTRMLHDAGFTDVTEKSWLSGATRLFVAQKP